MPKHFVLDTNILLHDPRAVLQFEDNEVVIPIFVLEEIDQFKKEASERGRNAREVARMLDAFRASGAHLAVGAPLPNGGQLRVAAGQRMVPTTTNLRENQIADHLILGVALDVRESNPNDQTIFVTKDVNLRLRADALGLRAMDYEAGRIDIDELYSGMTEVSVSGADVDAFYAQGALALTSSEVVPNQYVLLRDPESPSHTALGRYDAVSGKVVPLRKMRDGVWGIRPRNKEQHCALDLLLDDDVKLVTLVGKAGTGKTMLAHGGGAAEDGRGADLLAAAGVAADLPAGAGHRVPAGRPGGEAEPVDAADLRQRRVPAGAVQERTPRMGAATGS